MSAAIRVTAAQKSAVLTVLSRAHEFTDPAEFVNQLALAVITAEDTKTRWCVVTQTPTSDVYVFGPYATADTARKAAETAGLGVMPGTRGAIYPLIAAPKQQTTTTKRTTTKKGI